MGDAYILRTKNYEMQSKWENNEEIRIFREYLRIPTVQPNVDYGICRTYIYINICE